jgi:hypothetical protein
LDNQVGELRIKLAGYVIFAVGLILVIGNLFYCYPLITGKIFRPGRADGFYVSFPSYLFDTQKWLLSDVPKGRIIEYPDDEITQFSWGYRGIESILNLFSSSDSLFLPLNATSGEIAKLVKRYYLDIKRGAIESSQNLAYKMRAEYLFEKKDVNSLGLDLPERIKNLPVKNFSDEWFFYKLLKVTPPKIYPVNEFYTSYPFAKADEVVSVLPGQVALINPEDSIVKKSDDLLKDSGQIILAENSQAKDFYDFSSSDPNLANRLIDRDLNEVNFMFSVPADDYYQPVLESYSLGDYGLSDLGNLRIEIDDQEDHWKQNYASDSYVYFDKVFIKKGDHKITLTIDNKNLVSGGDFQGNTKINESSHGEKKVAYSILAEAENKYLGILNTGKANVSADFVVSDFDPLVPYNVQFKYKQTYGNNALVLAGQNNKNTLLKTEEERLPNYPEWNVFNFYYDPVKADSEMKVMLSAPFTNDPLGTKVSYDDLAVFKVFMNNLMFVKEQKTKIDLPEVNYQEISPTKYKVSVKNANGPHVLIFSENYSPGWQVTGTDKVSKNFIINHFSVNMFANAWYLADTPKDYELEINYRPQKLFDLGAGVAILTVIFSIAIVIKNKVKEK